MLVNFALECVGTVVTSDKVSVDSHECTNLVSNDWLARRRGFIAEHFIKPPVNITFQFPCNIQIYQIFVTPYVGQQLSSHVEIYSASKPSATATTHGRHRYTTKSDPVPSEVKSSLSSHPSVNKTSSDFFPPGNTTSPPLFYQVSKVSVADYGRICLTNPKFTFTSLSGSNSITEDGNLCLYQKTMQHFRTQLLSASSHLSVRLVQTQRGSSVAVSNIDIWGLPAVSVSPSVKNNITAQFTNFIRPRPSTGQRSHSTRREGTKQAAQDPVSMNREQKDQELSIPEEFIDPLTCEVMAIPMLLPCGKNVDLSTLDRFFSSEATHGRTPRDPFTGVVFSESSKPISNIPLKSRIDQFLLKHSNDKATSSIARTVNRKSGTELLGKRDVRGQRLNGTISSLIAPTSNKAKTPETSMITSSISTHHTSNILPTSLSTSQKQSKFNLSTETTVSPSTKLSLTVTPSCTSSASKTEPKSHEDKLKESLNSALASILSRTSSRSGDEAVSTVADLKTLECSFCKKLQSVSATVYNSPCNHTMCRQCLETKFHSGSTSVNCGVCGTPCKRKDFIRKHCI